MGKRFRNKKRARDGNGVPGAPAVERISDQDHAVLKALKDEMASMRTRKKALERDLALLTADIYRKEDEFNAKGMEMSKKYGISTTRALDMKTGTIIDCSKLPRKQS